MLFSQRKGLKPIKSVIQVDTVDRELRNGLWSAIVLWRLQYDQTERLSKFVSLMNKFWLSYFKESVDTSPDYNGIFARIRNVFFDGEWHDCYDILEFIAANDTDNELKAELIDNCNKALERELSAYRFVGDQITQITSETEISSIEEALADTQSLKPVHTHLKMALDYLSDRKSPDYRNSIKESISAVESLCNLITGSKATLGQAIKHVETKVEMHPALKSAFSSIYGYTSDAGGIRHALLDEPNLDFEDAKFMLVSCSAFINYLIAKSAKAGVTI